MSLKAKLNKELVDKLTPVDVIDGVTVYSVSDWLDVVYGKDAWNVPFEQSEKDLKEFCDNNYCSYYAAPREDFSLRAAVTYALLVGKSSVIVEDLS